MLYCALEPLITLYSFLGKKLSRYLTMAMPWERRMVSTGANTLVQIIGQMARPQPGSAMILLQSEGIADVPNKWGDEGLPDKGWLCQTW